MGRFCNGCGDDIDSEQGSVDIIVRTPKPTTPAELAALGHAVLAGAGMPRMRDDIDLCWNCFRSSGVHQALLDAIKTPAEPEAPLAGALTPEDLEALGLKHQHEDLL